MTGARRPRRAWLGDPGRSLAADCTLLALAVAGAAVTLAPGSDVARPVIVLLALCLLPGAAILTRVRVRDPLEAAALAVALSLGVEAAGALAMVWTGLWHPLAWAATLLAASCALLVLDLRHVLGAAGTREP